MREKGERKKRRQNRIRRRRRKWKRKPCCWVEVDNMGGRYQWWVVVAGGRVVGIRPSAVTRAPEKGKQRREKERCQE